jgi:hypothetical protein
MNYEEARRALLLHGDGVSDQLPLEEEGFLASLRPYSGLHERNFHVVMEALLSVGETIHEASQVDRELIGSVWSMCATARRLGVQADGPLMRNKLITPQDHSRLEWWIDIIERTALRLLTGNCPHFAIGHYAEYLIRAGGWINIAFFIPLLERVIADPEAGDSVEAAVAALGALGPVAEGSLPTLYAALDRPYTWFEPEERCTREMHQLIRQAIASVKPG